MSDALWYTTARATQELGRRPGDADADPCAPGCIRSRLDGASRRLWLAEDVHAAAKREGPQAVRLREAAEAERIFARWDADRKARAARLAAVHEGVRS